jgi:hypothetical protein
MKNRNSTFKVDGEMMQAAFRERQRIRKTTQRKVPCGRILRYWLLKGRQAHPKITEILP